MSPAAPRRACHCGRLVPCPEHRRRWSSLPRQLRGYDRTHERLRRVVLIEEPICRMCGTQPSTVCDHVLPLSLGGETARENLQGLCGRCSRSKSAREGRQAQLTAKARLRGSAGLAMPWAVPIFTRGLPQDCPSRFFHRGLKSGGER